MNKIFIFLAVTIAIHFLLVLYSFINSHKSKFSIRTAIICKVALIFFIPLIVFPGWYFFGSYVMRAAFCGFVSFICIWKH
jgi:hypothetical protein